MPGRNDFGACLVGLHKVTKFNYICMCRFMSEAFKRKNLTGAPVKCCHSFMGERFREHSHNLFHAYGPCRAHYVEENPEVAGQQKLPCSVCS